jgi:hypothetical protein
MSSYTILIFYFLCFNLNCKIVSISVDTPPRPMIFINLMKRITGKSDRIHRECTGEDVILVI